MEQGTNIFSFRVRYDREDDPKYPQYESLDIIADTRERAGELLEVEVQTIIDTFHTEPDLVTWEETLVDVS